MIGSYDLKEGYNIVQIESSRYVYKGEFVEVDGKHLGYEFQENQWTSDINSVFYRHPIPMRDRYVTTCYKTKNESYYDFQTKRNRFRDVVYSENCYEYYFYTRWELRTRFGSEIFSGKSTRIKFRAFYTEYIGSTCARSLSTTYSTAGTYTIEAKFSSSIYIKKFFSALTIYERKNYYLLSYIEKIFM